MRVFKTIEEWRSHRSSLSRDVQLGFVPTMGALHAGHASLVERSQKENDATVVSIFVNPTQFNESSDYENYPDTLEQDIALLEACGTHYLFLPTEAMMYPQGAQFSIESSHPVSQIFEGQARPGHFSGVLTVVMKLLNLIQPNKAYFGEKDFQQYQLIESMAKDFFLKTDIIPCPTYRENSGLPYSSRNSRLTDVEKSLANQAAEIIHQASPQTIKETREKLEALGIVIEYLDVHQGHLFSAIKINEIRLIDNFPCSVSQG